MYLIRIVLIICSIYWSYGYCQNIFGFNKPGGDAKSSTNLNTVLSPSDFNSAVSAMQKENQTALQNQIQEQQQGFAQHLKNTTPPPIPSPSDTLPEVGTTIPVPSPSTVPTPAPSATPNSNAATPELNPKNPSPAMAPSTSAINPSESGGDLYTGFSPNSNKTNSKKPSSSWSIKY